MARQPRANPSIPSETKYRSKPLLDSISDVEKDFNYLSNILIPIFVGKCTTTYREENSFKGGVQILVLLYVVLHLLVLIRSRRSYHFVPQDLDKEKKKNENGLLPFTTFNEQFIESDQKQYAFTKRVRELGLRPPKIRVVNAIHELQDIIEFSKDHRNLIVIKPSSLMSKKKITDANADQCYCAYINSAGKSAMRLVPVDTALFNDIYQYLISNLGLGDLLDKIVSPDYEKRIIDTVLKITNDKLYKFNWKPGHRELELYAKDLHQISKKLFKLCPFLKHELGFPALPASLSSYSLLNPFDKSPKQIVQFSHISHLHPVAYAGVGYGLWKILSSAHLANPGNLSLYSIALLLLLITNTYTTNRIKQISKFEGFSLKTLKPWLGFCPQEVVARKLLLFPTNDFQEMLTFITHTETAFKKIKRQLETWVEEDKITVTQKDSIRLLLPTISYKAELQTEVSDSKIEINRY